MLAIGPYTITHPLVLAPMAGVTDSVFRRICMELGAGYVVSEMVSADTTLHNSVKTQNRLLRTQPDVPHAVQIVGSDPDQMAAAAQHNVKLGAEIIDINMGCPAKKVCNKLAGSALLSNEKLVEQILSRIVSAVCVPVTLKIRTGPDRENRNGVRIAKIAERNGIQLLTVHGRTRADRFKGDAEYDTIASIKDSVNIPIIANGDIDSRDKANKVKACTHADGIMIGRAAQGNPWIFREVRSQLDATGQQQEVTEEEINIILLRHVKELHNLYGEYRGLRIARKHISWYCKNKRGAASFRNKINTAETAKEQLALIDQFFSHPDFFETTTKSCNKRVAA